MNDESLAICPSASGKKRQPNEQVNAMTNVIQGKATSPYESEFLSAGLWLSTIVFLSMTVAFAVISGLFSVFNIFCNPAQFLFSAFGLYVWNGIAAGLCFLTMIFWGSLYLIFISNNIGISDTLTSTAHYSSNDLAGLGFSYWILLVTLFLHLANIGLIYYRNYLLQREPRAPAITVSKNDSTILVY
jgi:clarin